MYKKDVVIKDGTFKHTLNGSNIFYPELTFVPFFNTLKISVFSLWWFYFVVVVFFCSSSFSSSSSWFIAHHRSIIKSLSANIAFTYPLIRFLHSGHLLMAGAHWPQVTMWPHGRNTMSARLSKHILHDCSSLSRAFSSFSRSIFISSQI